MAQCDGPEGRPLTDDIPLVKQGKIYKWFDNPWSTWQMPRKRDLLEIKKGMKQHRFPPEQGETNITLQRWDDATPDEIKNPPQDKIQATWIGHATVLVQMDGINILTDPMFSDYCSPIPIKSCKRYQPVPCQIKDLPKIHAVVISHNHLDHLDEKSVKELNSDNPKIRWYVPLEMKSFMKECSCGHVEESTWWEKKLIKIDDKIFEFVLTPAQHWSERGLFDPMKMLWGSWCVIGPKHKFYFAGDTGYCTTFKQIGEKYGPFDLAAIPIGAYEPREFLKYQHVNPEEAIKIHKDVRAKQSIAIHWGTFPLGGEPYLEPKEKLESCLEKAENKDIKFTTVIHGKPMVFSEGNGDIKQDGSEDFKDDQQKQDND